MAKSEIIDICLLLFIGFVVGMVYASIQTEHNIKNALDNFNGNIEFNNSYYHLNKLERIDIFMYKNNIVYPKNESLIMCYDIFRKGD